MKILQLSNLCGQFLFSMMIGIVNVAPTQALEQTKLYNTGPSEISGYIRFINAAANPVVISTGGSGKLELTASDEQRISAFQAVPANKKLQAVITIDGKKSDLEVTLAAEEFVNIIIQTDGSILTIRDKPDNFNALKAEIAFYNADPSCASAVMKAGEKQTVVFSDIQTGKLARRSVNPVNAKFIAECGQSPLNSALNLGLLKAGGRYSVIIIADKESGHRIIGGEDAKTQY